MNNVNIEYFNYNPKLHIKFPTIKKCEVYSKNGIINVSIVGSLIFNNISDDIGYDNLGRYISITIGQWHHIETGKYLSEEDFFELNEQETYLYDYVYVLIKIYTKNNYRSCYHNDFDKKVIISFIPYDILNFSSKDSDYNFNVIEK